MTTAVDTDSSSPSIHAQVMKTVSETPPLPASVTRLNGLFADPNYHVRDIVRAIELDPALCGRLLRMANSVNYSPGKVASVGQAVVRLGGGIVKSVAMAECLRPAKNLDLSPFRLTPSSYWRHTAAVVCFAEELTAHRVGEFGGDFPVAAVLHDFGKIILAQYLMAKRTYVPNQSSAPHSPDELESAIQSLDYAEVGAAVAAGWELPDNLVQAIRCQNQPRSFDHPLCYGLCIANQLARRMEGRDDEAEGMDNLEIAMEALWLSQQTLMDVADRGAARFNETLKLYS